MVFTLPRPLRVLAAAGLLVGATMLPALGPLSERAARAEPAGAPPLATVKTYVVTSVSDTPGDCTTPNSTTCTLRQAILDSNANPPGPGNTNLITFNIGTGLQTILLGSDLELITQPVVIDGTTQPGGGAAPRIQLRGNNPAFVTTGLKIFSPNVTVKGLIINRAASAGITIAPPQLGSPLPNTGGVTIQGNYIGVDAAGTTAEPNQIGIEIRGVPNNLIGGTASGAGNVISGNRNGGVIITGSTTNPTPGNVIQGNLIGTNAAGTAAVPNAFGIGIEAQNTTVGGSAPGAGNVISGNTGDGIVLVPGFGSPALQGNVFQGNFIGTDRTGTLALGNGMAGINTQGGNDNRVGGTAPGEGNTIAFNTGPGVAIGYPPASANPIVNNAATGNAVLGNVIYSNQGGGIVLAGVQTIPNDPQDPDPGPNRLQNYPIITSASTGAGGTTVSGTLNSNPSQPFRLEFFASPAPGSGIISQGQQLLGSVNVTTDAGGNASFTFTAPTALPAGRVVTATATNTQTNDTSGFSQQFPVTGGGTITPTATTTPTPVVPELPPLALFGSGLLLLGGIAYRARRRR